jgi:hypothetical protein
MASSRFFHCPLCGGSVPLSGLQGQVTCPHCGNLIAVPERLRVSIGSNRSVLRVFARPYARQANWRSYLTPLLIMALASLAGFVVCSFAWRYADSKISSFIELPNSDAPTAAHTPIAQAPAPAPTATSAPPMLPVIVAPTVSSAGSILFQDNFSNPTSGWERVNLGNHVADYVENGYRIYIDKSYPRHLTWIGDRYTNISVEVDAKQVAGPDDSFYGVICRAKAGRGSYTFKIASNGTYAIDKYVTEPVGESIPRISGGELPPNIIKRFDLNLISASCSNTRLVLSVNGQPVAQVDDQDFSSGGVGMVVSVGPSSRNGIDVLFSNFVVRGK